MASVCSNGIRESTHKVEDVVRKMCRIDGIASRPTQILIAPTGAIIDDHPRVGEELEATLARILSSPASTPWPWGRLPSRTRPQHPGDQGLLSHRLVMRVRCTRKTSETGRGGSRSWPEGLKAEGRSFRHPPGRSRIDSGRDRREPASGPTGPSVNDRLAGSVHGQWQHPGPMSIYQILWGVGFRTRPVTVGHGPDPARFTGAIDRHNTGRPTPKEWCLL